MPIVIALAKTFREFFRPLSLYYMPVAVQFITRIEILGEVEQSILIRAKYLDQICNSKCEPSKCANFHYCQERL